MSSIGRFLINLSLTGTSSLRTVEAIRRIRLTNIIALIGVCTSTPYVPLMLYFGQAVLALGVVVFVLGLLGCILLNYKGFYLSSRVTLIFFTSLALFVYTTVMGPQTGLHLVVFSLAAITFVLFSPIEKKWIVITYLMLVTTFFTLEVTDYSLLPRIDFPDAFVDVVFFISALNVFVIIFLVLYFYMKSNYQSELNLINSNVELQHLYEEAKERRLMLEKTSQQAAFTTLSMGIAHEIRNPMATMLLKSELMEEDFKHEEAITKYIQLIKTSIYRILKITDTMLKYGNPVSRERTSLSVNQILEEIMSIADGKCRTKGIRIIKEFSAVPLITGDANSLYQAFLNIILNAIQAMDNGGELRLRTAELPYLDKKSVMREGVLVEIADTGKGMSPEVMERIFDPFFTTKYDGTGLGLSMTLKYIDSHEGVIDVESEPDKGAVFKVHLPLSSSSPGNGSVFE